ncbi:hypothetical protein BV898_07090 [Hypsibius exemplaris]|uniref:Uncharacterized protein n=1 Tax=Hypsibius exemplaris TaxID=2072580 RepID=A0A1W0WUG0_HYPEX|nr:hypothetical protein BV898_07090 [Hypsibius exemplaris]
MGSQQSLRGLASLEQRRVEVALRREDLVREMKLNNVERQIRLTSEVAVTSCREADVLARARHCNRK